MSCLRKWGHVDLSVGEGADGDGEALCLQQVVSASMEPLVLASRASCAPGCIPLLSRQSSDADSLASRQCLAGELDSQILQT